MSDLIQRQEVIIALRESGLCYNNWLEVLGVIDSVPNAKEHVENGDLISREEVLRMIIVADECEPDLGYTHLHKVVENIPSAEPLVLTCDGCKHVGTYDTDFPCSGCIRREKDYYEPEE